MSTHRLPGSWTLIGDSIQTFVRAWPTLIPHAALLVLGMCIQNISGFVPKEEIVARFLVLLPTYALGTLVIFWATIRLYQIIFALHDGHAVNTRTTATALWLALPLVLVSLLGGVLTVIAFLLLIIPGIYVGVRLSLMQLVFVEEGTALASAPHAKKSAAFRAIGTALAESWDRTKGYFWPIFGRSLLAGLLFTLFVIVLILVLMFAVIVPTALLSLPIDSPIRLFLTLLVGAFLYTAFLALPLIFHVKLYRAIPKRPKGA